MSNKKRGRPGRLKAADLIEAGYRYRLTELTKKEKKEDVRSDSEDNDYFYKGDLRIYHVIECFYYNGSQVKFARQLSFIEAAHEENKKFASIKLTDTTPVNNIQVKQLKDNKSQPLAKVKGIIELKRGKDIGPLDGSLVPWDNSLPLFAVQFYDKQGKVHMARYKRNKEDNTTYEFEDII